MCEVITRCQLLEANTDQSEADSQKTVLLFGKYRVRIFPSSQLPLLANLSTSHAEVVVIDLPDSERIVPPASNTSIVVDDVDMEDSYVDDGTGPLLFSFLTLKKLQKNSRHLSRHRIFVSGVEFFGCNPLPANAAVDIPYKLLHSKDAPLDQTLCSLPLLVIADAGDVLGTTLVSSQLAKHRLHNSHTRFLGRFGDDCEGVLLSLLRRFPTKMSTRSKATAVYKILSSEISGEWAKKALLAEMSFSFKWSQNIKPSSYLVPPSPSSMATLRIAPGWMDPRICLQEQTMQLEHILALTQALTIPQFEMPWPQSSEEDGSILERVEALIGRCKGIQRETNIRFLDFTEELWDILRDCGSDASLVAGLRLVFDALRTCRINTILHNDNKSWMARLVRDSLSGDLRLPRLEALTPIQILLEIGIERFRRDMLHRFVSEKLATSEDELLGWLQSTDAAPETRARALVHVHLALQTMLEIKEKLRITSHQISNMTRSVLMQFCSQPNFDLSQLYFETEVALVDVHPEVMNEAEPWLWMNETTYVSKGTTVHTATQFCKEINYEHLWRKLPVLVAQPPEEEVPAKPDHRPSYVCTLTTHTSMTTTKN